MLLPLPVVLSGRNIDLLPACPYASRVVRMDTPGFPISADRRDSTTGYQFFWEYVPTGALICIDEGDIHFDSADHKIFGANCKIYHKQSRKFDHDIIYIVQNVSNLYKRIRSLTGRFILAEHTYKTLRVMGIFQSLFGKSFALSLSRFIYGEFRCDKFVPRNLAGVGHFSFAEARPMFGWYNTKQLLGHTEAVLRRSQSNGDAVTGNDVEAIGSADGRGGQRPAAGGESASSQVVLASCPARLRADLVAFCQSPQFNGLGLSPDAASAVVAAFTDHRASNRRRSVARAREILTHDSAAVGV